MRAYRVGATIADERGFGESVKIYGVYLFLEQGEKFRLFDYKKFGLKREEIAYITYKLKGGESEDELGAEFYANLIAQERTVYGVGDVEEIDC